MPIRHWLASALCISAVLWVPAADAATQEGEKQFAILDGGRELLQQHKPAQAISEHFDKVIRYYESHYAKSKKRIFCARTPEEGLFYLTMVAAEHVRGSDGGDAIVIDSAWADAYYLKAYALVELDHLPDAARLLERALELSPMNSLYLSESAHLQQAAKEWDKALETFKVATEAAETTTPEDQKTFELTRALRGQGFALIELNRLDEAEAIYRRVLELNQDDQGAKGEIRYLERMRANLAVESGPFTENPEWVITARIAFVEQDYVTARPALSPGDFKLWFPWIGGDLYGAPTTNDFIQPVVDSDYSFTIDLNKSRSHLIRSLDIADFKVMELTVEPADVRVARVATFTLKPDLSQRVGFTTWRDGDVTGDNFMLAYFDRACRISGTVRFDKDEGGRKYDLVVPAAGYHWLRTRDVGENDQEMVVVAKPADLVLAVTPLDE